MARLLEVGGGNIGQLNQLLHVLLHPIEKASLLLGELFALDNGVPRRLVDDGGFALLWNISSSILVVCFACESDET